MLLHTKKAVPNGHSAKWGGFGISVGDSRTFSDSKNPEHSEFGGCRANARTLAHRSLVGNNICGQRDKMQELCFIYMVEGHLALADLQ
jgi:hypothetical protein